MRRLDVRPAKKLRNPGRHLRQLARWPERIVDQIPDVSDFKYGRFWNFKVAVFAKLVEPPHATKATRTACLTALFAAAEAVERSSRRPRDCRIACLVTTPFLFESEVTIFLEEDYFGSFLPPAKPSRTEFDGGWIEATPLPPASAGWPAEQPPFNTDFDPVPQPEGLSFYGGTRLVECDPEWKDGLVTRTNWVWAYPRR